MFTLGEKKGLVYQTSQAAAFSCSFWLLTQLLETKMTFPSLSCVRCNFWGWIQRVMVHFRNQQELLLRACHCILEFHNSPCYVLIHSFGLTENIVYPALLSPLLSLSRILPSHAAGRVGFFWKFFAITDLSKTKDSSFWPPDPVNHPYKKALLALGREDFSFYPSTQCQNNPHSLGKIPSPSWNFQTSSGLQEPELSFYAKIFFQFTNFEEKVFFIFFRCIL